MQSLVTPPLMTGIFCVISVINLRGRTTRKFICNPRQLSEMSVRKTELLFGEKVRSEKTNAFVYKKDYHSPSLSSLIYSQSDSGIYMMYA